jgi:hypothetical protein
MVFWLFTYVFLGLAPLVQLRTATFPGTTPAMDPAYFTPSVVVVFVGVSAASVGFLLGGARRTQVSRTRAASGRPLVGGQDEEPRLSELGTLLLCVVGLLVAFRYISAVGVGTLFTTRAQRSAAENNLGLTSADLAIFKALAIYPLLIGFSALVRIRRQRLAAGRSLSLAVPSVILVVLLIVINPVTTPRYVVGTSGLAILVTVGIASSALRRRMLMLTLAAGLVLVFPYAAFARDPQQSSASTPGPVQALTTGDFDAFDQINNAMGYVDTLGHTDGRQLLGAGLFWIPRSVWPDKPRDTGTELAVFRGYRFTNLSAPVWAELFIDGGWPLLVLGMAALGTLLRRLDVTWWKSDIPGSAHRPGILASTLPFYLILCLRGSLLQSMAGLTTILVSTLVVTARGQSRPSTPPTETDPAQLMAG